MIVQKTLYLKKAANESSVLVFRHGCLLSLTRILDTGQAKAYVSETSFLGW